MKKLFKDLNIGDLFKFSRYVYIKIDDCRDLYDEGRYNCVILSKNNPGSPAYFDPEDVVEEFFEEIRRS